MDQWIVKQLRGAVLDDLASFVPPGHFDEKLEWANYNRHFQGAEYLSYEMQWGYQAATLGRKLYFYSPPGMSARQISAAEMLMHLGLLACTMTSQRACEDLSGQAAKKQLPDGNSGAVAKQLKDQHIPTLERNLLGGLKQYLLYLSNEQAEPFRRLLKHGRTSGPGTFL